MIAARCRKPQIRFFAVMILALCCIAAFGLGSAFAQEGPRFTRETWPRSVQSAVNILISDLTEANKDMLRKTPQNQLIRFHFGWGMGIRNDFGLWSGNQDLLLSACGKPCHPDDASMIIIEAVWAELQKSK